MRAIQVDSIRSDDAPAGAFKWSVAYSDPARVAAMIIRCPGCRSLSALSIRPWPDPSPSWEWDGNREAPTLSPSVLHTRHGDGRPHDGCGWHGWLRAGEWVSC